MCHISERGKAYKEVSVFLLEAMKALRRVFRLILMGVARGEGAEET